MSNSDDLDPVAEQRLKALLRGAVADQDESVRAPDVLLGVQEKLRLRSGGKFYDDAWSTARTPPVARYLITSLMMLVVMGVAFFILRPLAGRPEPVRNQPAPVEVVVPHPRTSVSHGSPAP